MYRFKLVLGLIVVTLTLPTTALAAFRPDTVTATGSSDDGKFSNVDISATGFGANWSGSASFTSDGLDGGGSVTCVSVIGLDLGGGTWERPTTAVLNFIDTRFGVVTVKLVDRGGYGQDTIAAGAIGRSATDCSLPLTGSTVTSTLARGRATVFDTPIVL